MADAASRPTDRGPQIRRRLTASALAALAVAGLIVLAGQHHTSQDLRDRLVDAELINRFGRQRMLSQRIAKVLYAIRDTPQVAPEMLTELRSAHREFGSGHRELLSRIPREEDLARQAELNEIAKRLRPLVDQIDSDVDAVIALATAPDGPAALPPPPDELLAACDAFCDLMEEVTSGHSRHLRENLSADARNRTMLLVSLLCGLTVLLVFLVIPAISHAAESQRKLTLELQKSLVQHAEQEALAFKIRRMSALDHAVLETAADSIVVIDADGIILSANGAAHRTFLAEPGSLVGRNVASLMPEPHASGHDGYVRRHLTTGENRIIGTTRELVARRLNGEPFPMELSVASTVVDGEVYFTGFVRDISERKRLELRLRQSEKLSSVGRLAAGIAHEMNTPLQFLSVNTKYLQDALEKLSQDLQAPSDGDRNRQGRSRLGPMLECIGENIEGLDRLVDIVQSMKEFSHPGEIAYTSFDLNHCIESVSKICRNRWKHVSRLDLQLAEDLPRCTGSANEISQVILNLIVNAADAIIEQRGDDPVELGKIVVRTTQRGDSILLEVGDDGAGIPTDVLPQVFDPFFTTKAVGEGTGQGLAIAYDIVVNKHGGAFDVESTEGEGTWFTATLPADHDAPNRHSVDSSVPHAAAAAATPTE